MRLIVADKALRRRAAELQAIAARAGRLPASTLRDSIPTDPVEFRRRFNEQAILWRVDPLPDDWRWPPVVVVAGRHPRWRRLLRRRPG